MPLDPAQRLPVLPLPWRPRRWRALRRAVAGFLRHEKGVISAWSLFLFMTVACVAGAAVDVTHLMAAQAQLQVAADSAAHAALLVRSRGGSAAEARAAAVAVAEFGMPRAGFGEALEAADILFGRYDAATDTFRVDPNSRTGVLVTAELVRADGNPSPSFFFRMAGVRSFDLRASAAVASIQPGCLTEGFNAERVVDTRSNNAFRNGFCLHANDHVEVNSNNLFETGVIVSMPDLSDFVMPSSGFAQNQGLQQALREEWYGLRVLDRIRPGAANPLDTAILQAGNPARPSYLTSTTVNTIAVSGNNFKVTPTSFAQGRVHRATCTGNQSITFQPANNGPTVYTGFVLLTNCPIQFSGRVDLRSTLIYTTSTDANSIRANSGGGGTVGLWVGQEDACAPGGGAQIVTRGGVRTSSKLTLNGAQILALGDVSFSAQAWGRGASIVSGGSISGTSNMDFGGCGTGMEGNITSPYLRVMR